MTTEEILSERLTAVQNECTRLLLENRELRRRDSLPSLHLAINDVAQFHNKFGVPVKARPKVPNKDRCELRYDLILEECVELTTAILAKDIVEIADGIADLIYVAIGTALEYGIPLAQVWDEVQRTNMAKVGGGESGKGKVMKPIGWKAPKIAAILDSAK